MAKLGGDQEHIYGILNAQVLAWQMKIYILSHQSFCVGFKHDGVLSLS